MIRGIEISSNGGSEYHDQPVKRDVRYFPRDNSQEITHATVLEDGPNAIRIFDGDGHYLDTPLGNISIGVNDGEESGVPEVYIWGEITENKLISAPIQVFPESPRSTRYGAIAETGTGQVKVNLPEVFGWPETKKRGVNAPERVVNQPSQTGPKVRNRL